LEWSLDPPLRTVAAVWTLTAAIHPTSSFFSFLGKVIGFPCGRGNVFSFFPSAAEEDNRPFLEFPVTELFSLLCTESTATVPFRRRFLLSFRRQHPPTRRMASGTFPSGNADRRFTSSSLLG